MKKQKWLVVLVLMLTIAAFAVPAFGASGQDAQVVDSVLDTATPISSEELQKQEAGEVLTDELLNTYTVNKIDSKVFNLEQQTQLEALGLNLDDVKKVEVKKDVLNYTGEIYQKYIIDTEHYICMDSDNQIKSIFNAGENIIAETWEDYWGTTEDQYIQTGNDVKTMLNLGSDYELVKSEEQSVDYWFLSYRKVLINGLVNENDGFNLTVARADNSIAFLTTFDSQENTLEAEITKEQAMQNAQPIIDKYTGQINNVELKYVQPNFFWSEGEFEPANFVRLAYRIQFDDNFFVDIDAVTGEIIGGDEFMAAGGSYGVTSVHDASARVNLAVNALKTLGYTVSYDLSHEASLKTNIVNFLKRSDAYAFCFSGHGSSNIIAENNAAGTDQVWSLSKSTIAGYGGNWDFVFLNCCSAGSASWASAFNISSTSTNKSFMGFSEKILSGNASSYARVFWPQVGNSRLYNGAIYAQNQLSGYAPLYFTGDRDYWGWAK